MNALFTIVARNYIGLARVLRQSLQTYSQAPFYIFYADEWPAAESGEAPPDVLEARKVLGWEEAEWKSWAFQYGLVEFCTAIKPDCFRYLMQEKGHEKVVYVDPDVFFFHAPDPLFDELDKASLVVTPHILHRQTPFRGDYPDHLFLLNGTFNLGFMGVRNDGVGREFIQWWHHRLRAGCFFDNDKGMATDQKWINLLPALFRPEELHVSYAPGWNVAPWNFHEREVVQEQGAFRIRLRDGAKDTAPLVFVHFSGYDYHGLARNTIQHKNQNATRYRDLDPVFEAYARALAASEFVAYATLRYTYARFDDGTPVLHLHRRFFRRLREQQVSLGDPFATGEGTFHDRLRRHRLLIPASAGASPDSQSNRNLKGFDARLRLMQRIFRLLKTVLGIRRYSLLVRFFRRFFTEENQLFLLDQEQGRTFQ